MLTGKMIVGIPNNITAEHKDFYISYNNRDTAIYGCDTTALVKNNQEKFFILNGNHTENYNAIINNNGSFAECFDYFKKHDAEKSKFSD